MIKSMTGFGKATADANGRTLVVEIRSLNSKSLDLNLRISSRYKDKEADVRNEVSRRAERGKIDLSIYFEQTEGTVKQVSINKALAVSYYKDLQDLSAEIGQQSSDWLGQIMRMPDVMTTEQKTEVSEAEWAVFSATLTQALDQFDAFRQKEGAVLENEMKSRVNSILSLQTKVDELAPGRTALIKQRLSDRLAEVKGEVDHNRLEQELIYYIEKFDITEERVRLTTHCDYFFDTMKEASNNGRKLGFISQEMGREINTTGSKANDATIQKLVVQMKDELEKIKEQLLNVL